MNGGAGSRAINPTWRVVQAPVPPIMIWRGANRVHNSGMATGTTSGELINDCYHATVSVTWGAGIRRLKLQCLMVIDHIGWGAGDSGAPVFGQDVAGGPYKALGIQVAGGVRRMNALALSLVLSACGGASAQLSATSPSTPLGYVITVDRTEATLERRGSWVGFRVTTTIHNNRTQPLFIMRCEVEAQRHIGDRWITVWNELCLATRMTPATIGPGDSLQRTLTVGGPTNPSDPLRLDERFGIGTFRIVFPLSYTRTTFYPTNLPSEANRASPEILVKDP